MGFLTNLADLIMVVLLLVHAIFTPLIGTQYILPANLYPIPAALVNFKNWYADISGDYLMQELPHFFVGIFLMELLLQWPLSVLNLVGILGKKAWLPTTLLMYGVSLTTSMVVILAEMIGSQRAPDTLLMVYTPYLGFSILVMLKGLFTLSDNSMTGGSRDAANRKKMA